MRAPIVAVALTLTVVVAGCDLQSSHMARQGSDTGPAPPPATANHAQPAEVSGPSAGTSTGNHPVQNFAAANPGSVTFDTPDDRWATDMRQAAINGQFTDIAFQLRFPASAAAPNYTYTLTHATVSKVVVAAVSANNPSPKATVTVASGTWSWQYQPVDAAGNPAGAVESASN